MGDLGQEQQRYAFVGCYTGFAPGQLGWVGSRRPGRGIRSFAFDAETGRLTPTGHLFAQDSPTWLEIHPNGRWLVAVHELSHHTGVEAGVGFVTSYRILPGGVLEKVRTQATGGRGNTCAKFDRTGRFLLVTRYWEGGISVLPFDAETGVVGAVTAAPVHTGSGPHPLRQAMPHPHGIHGDPSADWVYAMDLGTDKVHQYRLDRATGALRPEAAVALSPGSGPRGIQFHPTLRVAYVNCELDGTVVVCAVEPGAGLRPMQRVRCYPDGFVGRGHAENLGKADFWGAEGCLAGGHYYYICRVHQSLAAFAVDRADGRLRFTGRYALAAGSNARNLTADPSGRFLLVASQDANCVECFRVDKATGALQRVHTEAVDCAADVAVV